MPKFRIKVQEVEAMQFLKPPTASESSDGNELGNPLHQEQTQPAFPVGSWLVTHPDGFQECVSNEEFQSLYEEVAVVRRGRPPKSSGVAAVASTKRKRRRTRARSTKRGRKAEGNKAA